MADLSTFIPGKDLLKEIYHDLAKPGVQNVGKALSTVLGLGNTLLLPLHLANEKAAYWARRNLDMYRERIAKKSPESIQEPAAEVAVPILERLMYVRDQDVAELYASLLATASDVDSGGYAHPAFITLVGNLTPDEARIIGYLAERHVVPYETLRVGNNEKCFDRRRRIVTFDHSEVDLAFPDHATLYAQNLEALGVLEDKRVPFVLSMTVLWPDGSKSGLRSRFDGYWGITQSPRLEVNSSLHAVTTIRKQSRA